MHIKYHLIQSTLKREYLNSEGISASTPYGRSMRKMRVWVRASLFLSSYIPFFIAMSIVQINETMAFYGFEIPYISVGFWSLCLLSYLMLRDIMQQRKDEEPKPKPLDTYRRRNDLLTSYLIAYIFPFMGLSYDTWQGWTILAVFFFMLMFIQIRSGQLHINPVLMMRGYDIYEVVDQQSGNTDFLVADQDEDLKRGTPTAVQIGPDVYLTVGR